MEYRIERMTVFGKWESFIEVDGYHAALQEAKRLESRNSSCGYGLRVIETLTGEIVWSN